MEQILGILGGGQLGRMLAIAALQLGVRSRTFDPSSQACAKAASELIVGEYDDFSALDRFCTGATQCSYEFENVPLAAAEFIQKRSLLAPGLEALKISQDRLFEKKFFSELGIPTVEYRAAETLGELSSEVNSMLATGAVVVKTRRQGYDGKGQLTCRSSTDFESGSSSLGAGPWVIERRIDFRREISIIAARSKKGELAVYPLVQNVHGDGILRHSALASVTPAEIKQAHAYITAMLERLNYVGVITLELFDLGDKLIANEFAPRVHNSGHWTIECAQTSQFENHVRAVLGLPLGSTELVSDFQMFNLVGTFPTPEAVLNIPGAHLHLYGKSPRAGRKIGHITVSGKSESELTARAQAIRAIWGYQPR